MHRRARASLALQGSSRVSPAHRPASSARQAIINRTRARPFVWPVPWVSPSRIKDRQHARRACRARISQAKARGCASSARRDNTRARARPRCVSCVRQALPTDRQGPRERTSVSHARAGRSRPTRAPAHARHAIQAFFQPRSAGRHARNAPPGRTWPIKGPAPAPPARLGRLARPPLGLPSRSARPVPAARTATRQA